MFWIYWMKPWEILSLREKREWEKNRIYIGLPIGKFFLTLWLAISKWWENTQPTWPINSVKVWKIYLNHGKDTEKNPPRNFVYPTVHNKNGVPMANAPQRFHSVTNSLLLFSKLEIKRSLWRADVLAKRFGSKILLAENLRVLVS